ncbi:MAG: AAA family ATPase [Bradymonadia bacterium]
MYIDSITLKDVKCFKGEHTVSFRRPEGARHPYAGWTVVAGRNGTGKSTLLRAITFNTYTGHIRSFISPHLTSWTTQGSDEAVVTATYLLHRMEDVVEKSFTTTNTAPPKLTIGIDTRIDHMFLASYGASRMVSNQESELSQYRNSSPQIDRSISILRDGEPILDPTVWLKKINYERISQNLPIEKHLEGAVIDLLNDGLFPDGFQISKVDYEGLWFIKNDTLINIDSMSDGYRSVCALVLDIIRMLVIHVPMGAKEGFYILDGQVKTDIGIKIRYAEPGSNVSVYVDNCGTVLIDEASTYLHPSWQKKLGFWLKEHFPNIQFIVTTHSPLICHAADPGGLIRLPSPDEDRTIERVEGEQFNRIVNGTMDQAATSELFGLDTTRSEHSEQLRRELAEIEARMMRGKETEADIRRHGELLSQLPSSMSDDVERTLKAVNSQ